MFLVEGKAREDDSGAPPCLEDAELLRVLDWIALQIAAGTDGADVLRGLMERLLAAGMPVARVMLGGDTVDPVLAGTILRWERGAEEVARVDYSHQQHRDNAGVWENSPFYYLWHGPERVLRCRLEGDGPLEHQFPILAELRAQGITDYVAWVVRLEGQAAIGDLDGIFSSWACDRPGGFAEQHVALIQRLAPHLSLLTQAYALRRIVRTVAQTYLGQDPARRLLSGAVERGVAEKIPAVIWFSDLHGFTALVDRLSPRDVLPLLNDYADVVVEAVHAHGGQVLKFIGDGILAIFPIDGSAEEACRQSLRAAKSAFRTLRDLTERRRAAGQAVTGAYVALHTGDVFYGNVGALQRLDFTVVGAAVNETSRMLGLSRDLSCDLLLSETFVSMAGGGPHYRDLGEHSLRGVAAPRRIFTHPF